MMVLDGLEEIINRHAHHKPNSNPFKINFVRYADDFVVTCSNSEYLEQEIIYAGKIRIKFDFMQPLLVEDDRIYVILVNEGMAEQGKG